MVTKSCFSQWFPGSFEENGITYKTAEHYMMAEKARLFNDPETEEEILKANTPN
ncbi:NADAR family protein [Chryseobacterium sp. CBSDS_008]|uniref:NADAR family protein n=1 Tax=Chryseobacterium sp. CBSDS_008 TaxID=3415265 RepID=UPI003CF45E1C